MLRDAFHNELHSLLPCERQRSGPSGCYQPFENELPSAIITRHICSSILCKATQVSQDTKTKQMMSLQLRDIEGTEEKYFPCVNFRAEGETRLQSPGSPSSFLRIFKILLKKLIAYGDADWIEDHDGNCGPVIIFRMPLLTILTNHLGASDADNFSLHFQYFFEQSSGNSWSPKSNMHHIFTNFLRDDLPIRSSERNDPGTEQCASVFINNCPEGSTASASDAYEEHEKTHKIGPGFEISHQVEGDQENGRTSSSKTEVVSESWRTCSPNLHDKIRKLGCSRQEGEKPVRTELKLSESSFARWSKRLRTRRQLRL